MRLSLLLVVAAAGLFGILVPHQAGTAPMEITMPQIPSVPIEDVYYYHGRYYPYHYHGRHYAHRYYRYGHWHYY